MSWDSVPDVRPLLFAAAAVAAWHSGHSSSLFAFGSLSQPIRSHMIYI